MELNKIYNIDCLDGLRQMPDNSVDLLITDPPYKFVSGGGCGAFGSAKRYYHDEYLKLDHSDKSLNARKRKATFDTQNICDGFDIQVLNECCRVLKKINAYVWCSKEQLLDLMQFFKNKECNIDLLTWHKTNPIPTCNNTYLSDTEYLIYAREKGVKLMGEYSTKKKYWISECNVSDKELWKHPTIKPLNIIETLVGNSSVAGGVVLDPFMGSGTTAIAARNLDRQFIGFEIDETYYHNSLERLKNKPIRDKKDNEQIEFNFTAEDQE